MDPQGQINVLIDEVVRQNDKIKQLEGLLNIALSRINNLENYVAENEARHKICHVCK